MSSFENVLFANLAPPFYSSSTKHRTKYNEILTKTQLTNLAKEHGLYVDTAQSAYKCADCSLIMFNKLNRKLKYHKYSSCPHSLRRLRSNEHDRLQSFYCFKNAFKHAVCKSFNINDLASAGFYFNGSRNEIVCSYCDMVIVKLLKHEHLDELHSVYSPKCIFVVTKTNKPSAPTIENGNGNDTSIYPSVSSVLVNTDEKMCKICFENERNICFLPCRHVAVCKICAERCQACCMCRQLVKHKIEIYL
ncbi:Inhibitor of apoptosis 2 [Perigonia lusca single nucleopolyhedrovirus]|uniref:Inhibitor of apoptosis 2 n=1 Tax=Perigonia lusca single nucleopolyhedrovirus TaxID=1675865 RepID=A0A0M3WN74_9ABAC|nr:Inhibitor of apoptosis 2 [Perigonia lusca single nucleopolyhedrovirus]AKN80645.1 Inhibitor of apoptosis 2 [Perigonia lusca single nucleopolyhedrovirus]